MSMRKKAGALAFNGLSAVTSKTLHPSLKKKLASALGKNTDKMVASFLTVDRRQAENICRIKDIKKRKLELRKVREHCIGNEELLKKAVGKLTENGIRVLMAGDAKDAIKYILAEIGEENLVVKSKSNVAKEIGLADALKSENIEVVETDIGDRITQLAGETSSHPTGPASHMGKEEIAESISRHYGKPASEPNQIIDAIKEDIAKKVKSANIGITGANAITAEEGAVVLVHNEGNISKVRMLPKKHIIIAGIDKIYPSLESAINMVKLQTFYATGALITSYIDIITGPSKTADIEKKIYTGVHDPKEICLVLLDNSRSDIIKKGFGELLYCIGCGNCLLRCPVYCEIGSAFGGSSYLGGHGASVSAFPRLENAIESGIFVCTLCGTCRINCPVEIDIPGIIQKLRAMCHKDPRVRAYLKPYNIFTEALKSSIKLTNRSRPTGAEAGYFLGCMSKLIAPEIAESMSKTLSKIDKRVYAIDGCCGSVFKSIGREDESDKQRNEIANILSKCKMKSIVVSCPGCYDALHGLNKDTAVKTFVQYINALMRKNKVGFKRANLKATYHDPCHIGRYRGIYAEPREIISAIADLVEMERNKENSRCCGYGGGLPMYSRELSSKIAGRVIDDAVKTGADVLVTGGCPGCYKSLSDAAKKRIAVKDITTLIDENLR